MAVGSCRGFTVWFTLLVLPPLDHGAATYDLGTHLLLHLLLCSMDFPFVSGPQPSEGAPCSSGRAARTPLPLILTRRRRW